MVFAEALTEYLTAGLSEALAKAEKPTPPNPLPTDRYVALSALQKAACSEAMSPGNCSDAAWHPGSDG